MQLILFFLLIGFASFFEGIVGFGSALIAVPLSLTFLDKNTVISAFTIIAVFLDGFLAIKIKESINFKIFTPLFLASLLGIPIGLLILKIIPISIMKVGLGSLVILFAILILLVKIKFRHVKIFTFIAGFISGVLTTSTGVNGPPIVLLLTGTDIGKNEFRKILVFFFFLTSIVSLPLFIFTRVLNLERISLGIFSLPFVFLGGYLGNRVSGYVPKKIFKLLSLITVCATGIFSIYSGLK